MPNYKKRVRIGLSFSLGYNHDMSYEKLVRDKIPEIIEKKGKKPVVRVLDDEEYKKELLKKLVEEAQELLESSGDPSERADVEEVLRAIDSFFSFKTSAIESIRRAKAKERGAFELRLYLEGVK